MATATFGSFIRSMFAAALGILVFPCVAFAQAFPTRPVEFIVPWGVGGGSDQTARQVATLLETELKTPFPVVNAPGGTGNAGMTKFLSAPADGYTICILAWDTLALLASKPQKWTVDDFIPLGIVIQLPSGFYAATNGPYKTWADVEKAARDKPNAIKVAMSGFGSPDHITVNYFATKGLIFKAVPFAEPGERYSALLGGHVDVLYSPVGNIRSFVDGKQMHPILFFTSARLPDFANVPSSKESGYDITLPQRRAVIIRANTPPDRVKILADALAKVTAQDRYAEFLKRESAQPDSFVPTAEARKVMASDVAEMTRIVQATQGK